MSEDAVRYVWANVGASEVCKPQHGHTITAFRGQQHNWRVLMDQGEHAPSITLFCMCSDSESFVDAKRQAELWYEQACVLLDQPAFIADEPTNPGADELSGNLHELKAELIGEDRLQLNIDGHDIEGINPPKSALQDVIKLLEIFGTNRWRNFVPSTWLTAIEINIIGEEIV